MLDQPLLAGEAQRWRDVAGQWHALADAALPDDVPALARLRQLTARVTGAVVEGDAGAADGAAAAEELWRLRAEHDGAPPLDDERVTAVLAELSARLSAIHAAEGAAVAALGTVLDR